MKPRYQIEVDGQSINNIIDTENKTLLKTLQLSDKIGMASDTCNFQLVFDGSYKLPPTKGEVKVSIGYDSVIPRNPKIQYGIWEVGTYVVESVEYRSSKSEGDLAIVSATSMPQNGEQAYESLQNSHTRYWQSYDLKGTTFADVVNQVCTEAKLKANIHPDLADIKMPFTTQIGHTDAKFLTYISAIRDGKVKYLGDEVIITLKDKTNFPEVVLERNEIDLMSFSWKTSSKNDVKRVMAEYTDENNKIMKVTQGQGLPAHQIENRFSNKETAENAAKALLAHLQRKQVTVNLQIPTIPYLKAERPLKLTGFLGEINNEYIIEEVSHTLNKGSGLFSRITAQALPKL